MPYLGNVDYWENIPDGCEILKYTKNNNTPQEVLNVFNNHNHYLIIDGNIVPKENIIDLQLNEIKSNKINEIELACSNSIKYFTSSALGTQYTYLSDNEAMILFSGEYTFIKSDDYDGNLIPWYTVEEDYIEHTKEQFIQVYLDGRNNLQFNKLKKKDILERIKNATTIDEINNINW